MAGILQYLNALRPAAVVAETIFSPRTGETVLLVSLYVCNLSAVDIEYSVYFDNEGTTYDETTALAFNTDIRANTTEIIELQIPMGNSDGNLAVQTSSANDINFTLFGIR